MIGEAFGSPNYIPIEIVNLNKLREASGDRPYAEIIEEKAHKLSEVLVQQNSGDLFSSIQYCLREIMRNSIEHSQSAILVIFGQFWPALEKAEIVIYDVGVGVKKTLEDSEKYNELSNQEAITLSMEPGVSGVTAVEMENQHEYYRNSGFGLYVTSSFCAERGFLRIMSSDKTVSRNKMGFTVNDWPFEGTCIQMRISTKGIDGAKNRISEIIAEGERKLGIEGSASTSSKSLAS